MLSKVFAVAVFILVIVAAPVWRAAAGPEFVTEGLVSFWTFDKSDIEGDTVKDVWGENHGTMQGDPEIVEGKIEEGLQLDGEDDFVLLPDMGFLSQVTVEIWAKVEDLSVSTLHPLFSQEKWEPGTPHFKIRQATRDVKMQINDGPPELLAPIADLEGVWHHYLYTYDEDTIEANLYVDGELQDTQTGSTPHPADLTTPRIGNEYEPARMFCGVLDEVRVYDRVLSDDEIKANFGVKLNQTAVNPAGKLPLLWGKIKAAER